MIGSVVILARLLSPADFGIVTMVTTFSLLFRSFGLNGFTELIMQREDITDSLASNLFWINLGIGTTLTLVFASSGRLLALFYHNSAVAQVTAGMSLTIGIGCLGYIHLGLLQRAMHFRTTAIINFAGQLLLVIVSIVLAIAGWHYWALVWGCVMQSVVITAGTWLMCRWMPTRPRSAPGTGSGFKFALNVYSHFAFSYLTRNTDNLLVGWRYGARSLGFYKKAYDLFVLPESQLSAPLSGVVVSTLSRVSGDREQFQRYFLRAIAVLALVGMGVGGDFALVGKDLIRFLLGPGWEEAGRIFALFGPGIGVMLLYNTHGWIHLSIGRPERWLRWGSHGVCVYRESILTGFTLGSFRNRLSLDDFVFPPNVSRLLVCRKADRARNWAGIRRHLEIFCSIGWGWSRDCFDHQGYAVFRDGVRDSGRIRKDGFSFFGIFHAVFCQRDCAPPRAQTPQ